MIFTTIIYLYAILFDKQESFHGSFNYLIIYIYIYIKKKSNQMDININGITVIFPFKPYDIQVDYMRSVITALQNVRMLFFFSFILFICLFHPLNLNLN